MPRRSNSDLIREIKERRRKQIQECSESAAQKIHAWSGKGKLSVEALVEIIADEFSELNK